MIFNYILSDESINSKGFIVLTNGIDLESFHQNPVALHNHDINQVVGNWQDVKVNEQNSEELIGTIVFDYSDPKSQEIMNKVTKNLIKHVSIGIRILEFYEDIIDDIDVAVITKSELIEASVTPLPANKNAVKLTYGNYSIETISDLKKASLELNDTYGNNTIETISDLKKESLELNDTNNNKKAINMNSKLLELTNEVNDLKQQIGSSKQSFDAVTNENETFSEDIKNKDAEILTLSDEVKSLKDKLAEIKDAEDTKVFNDLIDSAIEDSKIKESQKEDFLKLSYENAKTILNGLESKNIKPELKLTDLIDNKDDKKVSGNDMGWYEKNDVEGLKLMYKEDREKYDKLYNEYYK